MESIKWKGYKVFILVAEIRQGIYAAFLSNIIEGVDKLAEQWVESAAAQIFWNLRRRLVSEEDISLLISHCFEDFELAKIDRSRWSNSKKMAVVDTRSSFDLEAMEANSGAVDVTKGLNPEEKQDRAMLKEIKFARNKAGQFAIEQIKDDLSLKTATPGEPIPKKKNG